jgi:predicted small lipoprotein YifL
MRRYFKLALLLLTIAVGACGTRGPLYLPQPPSGTTPPPANADTPVKQAPSEAPSAAIDLNTAKAFS